MAKDLLKQYNNIKNEININSLLKKEKNKNNLLKVFGIGNQKIKELKKININTINKLKNAVESKKVDLTHQQLLGLKYYDKMEHCINRATIITITDKLRTILNSIPHKNKIEITNAGSFRAGKPYAGDIDLIVHSKHINTKIINCSK